MVWGMGWAWGPCVRVGNAIGRYPSNRQVGSSSREETPALASQLPPPKAQQIQAAPSCGGAGTTTLALAVGHGGAGRASLDVTWSCSDLGDASQPPGPALWGTLVAGELGRIGSLL